jgi:hypothetical protein
MSESLVVKCGGNIVHFRPSQPGPKVVSRWSGELEESRQEFVSKASKWVVTVLLPVYGMRFVHSAVAATQSVSQIRAGFDQLFNVFTALAEPVLWFYALTACIMMATGKNKEVGWGRLKNVGYGYIGITLLPTFFSFMRWIAHIIQGAISIGG